MAPKKAPRSDTTAAQLSSQRVKKGSLDPDLPMDPSTGKVYHLACTEKDLANRFIFVGDPGRVPIVAERFDKKSITFDGTHREIRIMTGTYKGVRVTALSTGMGTDNCEIILNEIHALKEFNLSKMEWGWKCDPHYATPNIRIIRMGTCGSPQAALPLGTFAISRFGIGMDNTCRYYGAPSTHDPHISSFLKQPFVSALDKDVGLVALRDAVSKGTSFQNVGGVYCSASDKGLVQALSQTAGKILKDHPSYPSGSVVGITASGSGFYGCQGRAVGRLASSLSVPNLVDELGSIRVVIPPSSQFALNGGTLGGNMSSSSSSSATKTKGKKTTVDPEEEDVVRVENIEMENSAVTYLASRLGYHAATICTVIARRAGEVREFASPQLSAQSIQLGILIALETIVQD